MGGAFYNEIDPKAAAWLRELIAQGHIAPGVVDERDIRDLRPAELAGYSQCHFFAGIGVWSYALRRAGWPDDRHVWTGSCPCQPFSAAGKGGGFDDERHLWPAWFWLIEQCRPGNLFGEQVASKDAEPWLDLVQDDLEALGYAFGACAFPSAGIGAPHIRDRTYWMADAAGGRQSGGLWQRGSTEWAEGAVGGHGATVELADAYGSGAGDRPGDNAETARLSEAQCEPEHSAALSQRAGANGGGLGLHSSSGLPGDNKPAGPVNGLWRDADWLLCRDGKWRPVEPGTFPLAHGAPARVGRLRGYGNAINGEAAAAFIQACAE